MSIHENPVVHHSDRIFSSKLLLFGEYSVVVGGKALAIPLSKYKGRWEFGNGNQKDLYLFSEFLEKSVDFDFLKIQSFKSDLEKGLFFESDIPLGYGMGSSGALVAGVFDRYSSEKDLDPSDLKLVLGKMENFFHGSSSGLDPLVSLLQRMVLIDKDQGGISFPQTDFNYSIFLIDTQKSRNTAPLVNWFLEQLKVPSFNQIIEKELVPSNNRAISYYLEGMEEDLFYEWGQVGDIQKNYLTPMIPEKFYQYMGQGENSTVKLCGAGGGGFLMGLAKDKEKVVRSFMSEGIDIIWI